MYAGAQIRQRHGAKSATLINCVGSTFIGSQLNSFGNCNWSRYTRKRTERVAIYNISIKASDSVLALTHSIMDGWKVKALCTLAAKQGQDPVEVKEVSDKQ